MSMPALIVPPSWTFTVSTRGDEFALGTLPDGRQAIAPISELPRSLTVANSTPVVEVVPGEPVVVSAFRPELVASLYFGVCPELRDGSVQVVSVARRAGVRTKIAVASTRPDVDAVAALLGRDANRVKYVAARLGGERIEVIPYHGDLATFVSNALAPARALRIEVSDDRVVAYVAAHQVPAAIGGGGLNSALAGELVGRTIDVVAA